jgi:4-amino-4-deoxy-L-arabinose transferase-like glycosyltransferase
MTAAPPENVRKRFGLRRLQAELRRRIGPLCIALGLAVGVWTALGPQRAKSVVPMVLGFAVAATLFTIGSGLPAREASDPEPELGSEVAPSWRRRVRLGAVLGGALLVAALIAFARADSASVWGWRLYVLALVVAFLPLLGRGAAAVHDFPPIAPWEWLALFGVLALAALFRFHLIAEKPYGVWYDEAENALEATHIVRDPSYRPVFVAGLSQMPALPFYYFAPFVATLGSNVLAVRVATTLAALAAVAACWLLARALFGRAEGLIAAALLAVSRWHITFSRFGMTMIFMSLFVPLTLYLFVRSQRRQSARTAALAGLALGLGLQFYYAMQAIAGVLVFNLGHRLVLPRIRRARALGLFLVTVAAAAFVYAPVLQYAAKHRHEFAERMATVSIVPSGSPAQLARLFLEDSPKRRETLAKLHTTLERHARMFHLEGDSNGRHNLPGRPMLDPLSGLLFVVGLCWTLVRIRDPRSSLLLLWFVAALAPGVFSLEFEAPQAARTFGVTPLLAIFAALPLAQASRALAASSERARSACAALVPALCVGVVAVGTWHTYFSVQLFDPAVWSAFSIQETKIAHVVRDEGRGADVWVPETLLDTPTQELILGRHLQAKAFRAGRDLPLVPDGRRALLFVLGEEKDAIHRLQSYYPHASLTPFGPPRPDGGEGEPVLWIARIPPADIAALAGWTMGFAGASGARVTAHVMRADWEWSTVAARIASTVAVRGVLRVSEYGPHRVTVTSSQPVHLRIDELAVLSGRGRQSADMMLAIGDHDVALDVRLGSPGGRTTLTWQPPRSPSEEPLPPSRMYSASLAGGLVGSYIRGLDPTAHPVFAQVDPQVAFYFHNLPLPRPFSVTWKGEVFAATAGEYRFGTNSINASSVRVDEREVVANEGLNTYREGATPLTPGWHAIEVRYANSTDYAQIYLYWVAPGRAKEVIPSQALRPAPPAVLPATPAPAR